MLKSLALLLIVALTSLTGGCAFWRQDRIHYTWNSESAVPCATCSPAAQGADFIGLALSGGGARASVFGAAAIEALAEEGVMAHVTHISSVSGGGFPAAYYVLNQPEPCSPAERQNNPSCVSDSYEAFRAAMTHNYLSDLTVRQLFNPNRFSSPTRRLSSLQDALDEKFIGEAVFGDLPPTPVLLINGARYDDGRRFVFSNLAIPEQQSNIEPFTEETLRTASFSLPGCTRPAPKEFPVSLAIAISAGFPPLLGPAAIEAPESCDRPPTQYWHLGDGGILDNTGVETLEDYALHAETGADPISRVIIFAMDAGRSTAPDVMMRTRNLKLWTSDPGRVVDIVGKRANAYRNAAIRNYYAKSGAEFHVLEMRYTDARIASWPPSCGEQQGGPDAILSHLASIPTNFKITQCDADLMTLAAHDLVRRTLKENRPVLERAGILAPEHAAKK